MIILYVDLKAKLTNNSNALNSKNANLSKSSSKSNVSSNFLYYTFIDGLIFSRLTRIEINSFYNKILEVRKHFWAYK